MSAKGLTLCVQGVDENKTEEEIKKEFEKFGTVTEAHNTGKGFAFVTFENEESGEIAIKEMNEKKIIKWRFKVNIRMTNNLVSISSEVKRLMLQ
jgi:RNA recognition motif-containing protein